jgi:hypothetical protein
LNRAFFCHPTYPYPVIFRLERPSAALTFQAGALFVPFLPAPVNLFVVDPWVWHRGTLLCCHAISTLYHSAAGTNRNGFERGVRG